MPEWLKAVLSKFTDGRRAVERGFLLCGLRPLMKITQMLSMLKLT